MPPAFYSPSDRAHGAASSEASCLGRACIPPRPAGAGNRSVEALLGQSHPRSMAVRPRASIERRSQACPASPLLYTFDMKTLLPMLSLVGLSLLSIGTTGCETRERVVVRNPPPATVRVYAPAPVVQERVIVR
jgi:hypothetical protein